MARTGVPVMLDGTASYDPDAGPEPLAFAWGFVRVPLGSQLIDVDIQDADTPTPSFTPDVAGLYVFERIVTDGKAHDLAHVRVTAGGPPEPPRSPRGRAIGQSVLLQRQGAAVEGP
jgi:hypothetical protein